jgi:hypothetical protein
MQYKENINEIYSILDSYFRNKKHQLEDSQVDQIHKCYNKLTNEAKISLLENCEFTFYVNNINLSRQRLYAEHILDIEDSTFVYLIYKIIDFMHFKNKDIELIINLKTYDKEVIELLKIVKSATFIIDYSKPGYTPFIDLKRIDNLYTNTNKKIAKGNYNSITGLLSSKKIKLKFKPHPDTKNEIVSIEKLKKSYLNLNNKYVEFFCPICEEKNIINKNNILNLFTFQNKLTLEFNCDHSNSPDHIKSLPFKINLAKYPVHSLNNETDKIMFFINNSRKLIEDQK